jgi:thiol:disulfide interchange protein
LQANSLALDEGTFFMNHSLAHGLAFALVLGISLGGVSATGQESGQAQSQRDRDIPVFQLPGDLALPARSVGNEDPEFSSQFQIAKGSREGRLSFTVKLPPEWHVYSLTQKPGGPLKSKIKVTPPEGVEVTGPFQPNRDPEVHQYPDIYGDLPVEEHAGEVTWTAPIRLAEGVNPDGIKIAGAYDGLQCRSGDAGQCKRIPTTPFSAEFAGYYEPPAKGGEYRAASSAIAIRGRLEPQVVTPGGSAKLVLEAIPDENYHVYAHREKPDADAVAKPTLIVLPKTSGLTASSAEASKEPIVKPAADGLPEQQYHEGAVTWTIDLSVPTDASVGEYPISGLIGYQVCTETSCQRPLAASFEGTVTVGANEQAGQIPLAFASAKYTDAQKLAKSQPAPAASIKKQAAAAPLSVATLVTMLGAGVLGGLILNLMPCVLPVIGLKVLSFAQQGGESRGRVLALNLSFSIGLLSVFVALASLAAFAQLGWGEQFTSLGFKVFMTGLVFAMALSFLGIWEIPIPGFSGGKKASELQEREGLDGAFFKGVFTTILATPCSGPFLGPVFGFTLAQPPWVTYALFMSVGLGMASPYLILGFAPGLVRFLPRPGMWMETFKEVMGFILLGTVVFLFSTINRDYYIPTLTLMVGIWFACWWIGRTSYAAATGKRIGAWIGGAATATAIGLFAFTVLGPSKEMLPWQPWSPSALAQAQAQGRTVMVDFTADWCPTCKWNLKTAINTDKVKEIVEKHDIAPLLADWTDHNDEIKQALLELDSNSIPVMAIYPADRPHEPIILRDLLNESKVLEALEQAGPSKSAEKETVAARDTNGVQ